MKKDDGYEKLFKLLTDKNRRRISSVCPQPIFRGKLSKKMWKEINTAKTVDDLRGALYGVCCRLQELESKIESHNTTENTVAQPVRQVGLSDRFVVFVDGMDGDVYVGFETMTNAIQAAFKAHAKKVVVKKIVG